MMMDCKTCNGSGKTVVLPAHLSIIGVATYKTCADCEGTGRSKFDQKFLKRIQVGAYSPAALLQEVRRGYRVMKSAEVIVGKMARCRSLSWVRLGTVTAGELGFGGRFAAIHELTSAGLKEGLRLCPDEVALHLAPQYLDDVPLIVASPHILDNLGIPRVLCFQVYYDEMALSAIDLGAAWRQSADTRIVFLMD